MNYTHKEVFLVAAPVEAYPNTRKDRLNEVNIVQAFDEAYNDAYYSWNSFLNLAEEDLRFYLGDQFDEKEKQKLFSEGRNAFVFNRIRRNINLITGYQRKNRLSSVVLPFENDDQETADQRTQVLMHIMNKSNGYNVISDCFAGAMKTGFNLCALWKDYRDDPVNGDIQMSREPYNGFIVDPYFSKQDLSDCAFIAMRRYLSVEQVASLLPKHKKEIYELNKIGWERDDKFTWLPYQRQPNGEWMMAYNEMWTMNWETVPVLVDSETGEFTEFNAPKSVIKQFLEQYPELELAQKQVQYVEKHVIVNDAHIETVKNPYGLNEYPFVPFLAIFEPESDQWELKVQSLVRCMKDPQKESNRRRSQMVDIVDSQLNSGWIADEDSVVNPQSLFKSGQGNVVWKKLDAKPDALTKIPPAQIPQGLFQLQQTFDNDMLEIAGINDAAFGVADSGNESGVMMMMRQGAALTNLQDYFDSLRFSQKLISEKILKMIQTWKPSKIKRIINQEPSEGFYDYEGIKYDVSVQEGVLTDTQKQLYFRQLLDLQQVGAPVTPSMLARAAPIQGASTYLKEIEQLEKQQAEAVAKQEEVQQQLIQSQTNMSTAKAISDTALAKERFTRSMANLGLNAERQSEAIQNSAQANLDRAKTMKELEAMDDARLERYFNMIQRMEVMNNAKADQEEREDLMITEASEQFNAFAPNIQLPQPKAPAPVAPQPTSDFGGQL